MLKSLKNKENISLDKELLKPHENSKKIYVKSQRFSDVSVPMRKIDLDDPELKNLIVYDTSGLYTDEHIAFASNRLAIQDLSDGNQPFEFKNFVSIFNGEIYNFKEIKFELEKKLYKYNRKWFN